MNKRNYNRFPGVSAWFRLGPPLFSALAAALFMGGVALASAAADSTNAVTGIIGHPGPSAFIDSARTGRLLRIGMVDCVAWTLQNNSEILIKKIDPKLRDDDVAIARAVFEPNFYANAVLDGNRSPFPLPMNVYSSSVSRAVEVGAGVAGKLPPGTRYQLDFLGQRNDSDPAIKAVNPVYFAEPMITITQPIFKGAGFEVNEAEIVIASNYRNISAKDVRATVMQSISRAIIAYYNYCYSQEYKEIAAASLKRAQDLLAINRERYQHGIISSVDLLETETAVAEREKAVIVADALVSGTEDELKLVTNLVDDPELWNARLEPIDRPKLELRRTDLAQSLRNAFEFRPDYQIKTIELKNRDIAIKLADNNHRPALDLFGSYGMNGWGGDYGDALNTVEPGNSDWTVGLKFARPWGGAESAKLDQTKREKMKASLELKRLEQNIILDVRTRIREVETQRRQMDAARHARDMEAKNYEAQRERYAAGQVSTHDMLDYQERVATSETDYLKAVVDYQTALVALDNAEGITLAKNNIRLEE
ncbi:MAG: TolC family protein [Kiritimatiellae bacterium]|nr:TolC family protein [Kiritimatiellia bacterium]